MKTRQFPLICVVVFVTLVGCNNSTSTSDHAYDSFKSFAANLQADLPRVLVLENQKLIQPVSFDVETTPSLVSPFTAYVTFSGSGPIKHELVQCLATENVRADYAHQEGAWVCKQIVLIGAEVKFVSGNRQLFDAIKEKWVGRTLAVFKDADVPSSDNDLVKLLRDCNP